MLIMDIIFIKDQLVQQLWPTGGLHRQICWEDWI